MQTYVRSLSRYLGFSVQLDWQRLLSWQAVLFGIHFIQRSQVSQQNTARWSTLLILTVSDFDMVADWVTATLKYHPKVVDD